MLYYELAEVGKFEIPFLERMSLFRLFVKFTKTENEQNKAESKIMKEILKLASSSKKISKSYKGVPFASREEIEKNCYRILLIIREIIKINNLSDNEYFGKIEEITDVFNAMGYRSHVWA